MAVVKEAYLLLTQYYNMGGEISKDIGRVSDTSYEVRVEALRDAEKRADEDGGHENKKERR